MSSKINVSETVREAFNFSVDRFPLAGPDGMKTPWFALFRSDTCEVVGNGSVTKSYVPHTVEDVCSLVDAASEVFGDEIECSTHFRHGHYVDIRPTKIERLRLHDADDVYPRLIIKAGYDGRAFTATMGYWREVCRNLAMPRLVKGLSVNIRHTKGLRLKMDDLINDFQRLSGSWDSLSDMIQRMSTKEVRMAEFLNQVYPQPSSEQLALADSGQSVRAVTVHRNRTMKIWERLNRERNALRLPAMSGDTVTAWEAYNAIQGYVQHDATAKTGFTGGFDRILRAANDPSVRLAERLAVAAV